MWGLRVEGRLVTLRPIREDELGLLSAWGEEPEAIRFLGSPYHAEAPGSLRKRWEEEGNDPTSINWGLEHEGRLVGRNSIHHIDWVNRNGATGTFIGDRSVWGRGIASEAMRLRAAYAFRQLDLHKLISGYTETNAGSGRAQERAGYRIVGRLRKDDYRDGRRHDVIITELLRADWQEAPD